MREDGQIARSSILWVDNAMLVQRLIDMGSPAGSRAIPVESVYGYARRILQNLRTYEIEGIRDAVQRLAGVLDDCVADLSTHRAYRDVLAAMYSALSDDVWASGIGVNLNRVWIVSGPLENSQGRSCIEPRASCLRLFDYCGKAMGLCADAR
jgi:hypothetical protein